MPAGPRGRMPIVDEIAYAAATEAIGKRCREGVGFAFIGSFAKFMATFTRQTMKRYGVTNSETIPIPFSESAYKKLYWKMVPCKIREGDRQDLARFKRKIDLLGLICHSAAMYAAKCDSARLLHPESRLAIRTILTLNQDAFAALIFNGMKKGAVRVNSACKAAHRKNGFGIKTLSDSAFQKLSSKPLMITNPRAPAIDPILQAPPTAPPVLTRIRRDDDEKFPIVTLPGSADYPPKCRSFAKRGIKIDMMSHAAGYLLCYILTIVQLNCPSGFHLHQLSEMLWVVFRPKVVNEVELAMKKESEAFLPAQSKLREKVIAEHIFSNNKLREVELQQHPLREPSVPFLTRDLINMEEFRMLKTMDGCGVELNAIINVINGDAALGSMLDADNADLDEDDDQCVEEDVQTSEFEGLDSIRQEASSSSSSGSADHAGGGGGSVPSHDNDTVNAAQIFALEQEINRSLPSILPECMTILKPLSQATMMVQAHDVVKLHYYLRHSLDDISDCLLENQDESEVPVYMALFQRLMELYKVDKKSQRSYFFVVANFERKAHAAAMKSDLRKGYKKSASGSFNIVDSLEHWAGKETLTEEDKIFIEEQFPALVDTCLTQGTVHPEFAVEFMGSFIYDKHIHALSEEALTLLAQDESKKPVGSRPVSQFGSVILTNEGHKRLMLQRIEERRVQAQLLLTERTARTDSRQRVAEQSSAAREDAAARRAIRANAALIKNQLAEAKRLEIANAKKIEAQQVYDAYKVDNSGVNEGYALIEKWVRMPAATVKSAYTYFVVPNLVAGTTPASRKDECITALRVAFALEPQDLDLHTDASETTNDEEASVPEQDDED